MAKAKTKKRAAPAPYKRSGASSMRSKAKVAKAAESLAEVAPALPAPLEDTGLVAPVDPGPPDPALMPRVVACRYCGAPMAVLPGDSTFYACGCVDTGALVNDRFGKVTAA